MGRRASNSNEKLEPDHNRLIVPENALKCRESSRHTEAPGRHPPTSAGRFARSRYRPFSATSVASPAGRAARPAVA